MVNEEKREFVTPPPIKPYMTREKALELLSDELKNDAIPLDKDFIDALKLAIHALQEVIKLHPRLPGV